MTTVGVGAEPHVEPRERDAEFDDFVRIASSGLRRYAYLLTGNPASADDLLQETLVKVYLAWGKVVDRGALTAYSRTTMTRTHISTWRKWHREVAVPYLATNAVVPAAMPEERAAMWQLLEGLTRMQRTCLVLRYYEDLSDQQIADVLNCSPGNVRAHMSRGMERLRDAHAAAAEVER